MGQKIYIVVGVYDTLEFIEEARKDSKTIVYAFEPNPEVVKRIYENISLPRNYHLLQKAVSDYTGKAYFNVCTNSPCSSLKKFGDGPSFGEMSPVEVDVVKLSDFCSENSIKEIEFLHIDAQGSDYEVLKGAEEKLRIVKTGKCESLAEHVQYRLYENQASFLDITTYLKQFNFNIEYALNYDNGCPGDEVNITFTNNRVPRQVGMLLMKDEDDILEEYLDKIVNFYDNILVLDGSSSEEGKNICSKYPEVIFYAKDKEFTEHSGDWIRGFLYERIKQVCPDKQWVGILHPDEFPSSDTLDFLTYINRNFPLSDSAMIRNIHYFPHITQKKDWKYAKGDKLESQMKWGMLPGHLEFRYFKFDPNLYYQRIHGHVVPYKQGYAVFRTNSDYYHHKHFTIRSTEQMKKRCETRLENGWSEWYEYIKDKEDIFFSYLKTLPPNDTDLPENYPYKII
jgi:FkbM family methyltransferase